MSNIFDKSKKELMYFECRKPCDLKVDYLRLKNNITKERVMVVTWSDDNDSATEHEEEKK